MQRNQLLPPLPESEWPTGLVENINGKILNIHRMIAHNPALMTAYAPFRNYIVQHSTLSDRQRELLILRTAHNVQSKYEWTHHVIRGRVVGISDVEIARVQEGPDANGWSIGEATLLRTADEMHQSQQLQVETIHNLQAYVGNEGVIDVLFTVGVYLTLGTILKTFDVPLDEAIKPLG